MAKKSVPNERWNKLKVIADHPDTCEMGANIRMTLLNPGSGQQDAFWIVGGKVKSRKSAKSAKSAKKKPGR
jgi:hypothetical protein